MKLIETCPLSNVTPGTVLALHAIQGYFLAWLSMRLGSTWGYQKLAKVDCLINAIGCLTVTGAHNQGLQDAAYLHVLTAFLYIKVPTWLTLLSC